MIGIIFGIYALCTLVGSLVLGKYVSYLLLYTDKTSLFFLMDCMLYPRSRPLFQIVQIGAKFMIVAGLFLSSGCTVLFG